MNLQKRPPYRSRKFLAFCHKEGGLCCLCGSNFEHLHHFGDDGGRGLKPSDNEVARVCGDCHRKNDFKRKSLLKNRRYDILESYQNDALKINRAYIEKLEGK